jgi:hypothetical protein
MALVSKENASKLEKVLKDYNVIKSQSLQLSNLYIISKLSAISERFKSSL